MLSFCSLVPKGGQVLPSVFFTITNFTLFRSASALFDLEWLEDGSIAFKANNGKYIGTKKSGHLYANCDGIEDKTKYFFYLVNRPVLVLKGEQGFVGYKSANSNVLECNKATYETIQVERGEKGQVHFKGKLLSHARN